MIGSASHLRNTNSILGGGLCQLQHILRSKKVILNEIKFLYKEVKSIEQI
jgi:hypothetical protein